MANPEGSVGDICSCRIAGVIDGNIYHDGVVVPGESALVIGDVFGGDVFIHGSVTGTVHAAGLVRFYPGASVGCEVIADELDNDPRACVPPAFLPRHRAIFSGPAPAQQPRVVGSRARGIAALRPEHPGARTTECVRDCPRFVG